MERTRTGPPPITGRQREVWKLIAQGRTNAEVAEALGISLAGAKWHVSELLDRLDVATREELAHLYREEHRWHRRLAALLPAGMLAGPAKGAAVGAAGVVAVTGVAVAVVVYASGGDAPAIEAAAAPSPGPASVALPGAPGAIFTPQEALEAARTWASAQLALFDQGLFPQPLRIVDFRLAEARWLPGATGFDSTNGDTYWEPAGGAARDAWQFLWRLEGITVTQGLPGSPPPSATVVEVEVILADGERGEPLAHRRLLFDPAGHDPAGIGGAQNFRSRARDARIAGATSASGPPATVAWLDNVPGGPYVAVYPTASGWCVSTHQASGEATATSCGDLPVGSPLAITAVEARVQPGGGWTGDVRLQLQVALDVERVRIEPAVGASFTLEVPERPAGSPLDVRFLFVSVPADHFPGTVVALADDGEELARAPLPMP